MKIYVKHKMRLKMERAMQGYTQRAFADKVGISNVRLCQLENEPYQYVSVNTATNIVNTLKCEWGDIFDFDEG